MYGRSLRAYWAEDLHLQHEPFNSFLPTTEDLRFAPTAGLLCSFLSLLMLGIDTDNAHHTLAVNHFALITNLFDGRTYLHWTLTILFIPVSYAAAIQIVGRQLNQHSITRKDSNEMLTHFA